MTMNEEQIRRDERALIVKQIIDVANWLERTEKPIHFTEEEYKGYISGVWDTIVRIS